MSDNEYIPSRDEILDSFAIEEKMNLSVLKHYQYQYPEFAIELVELYNELFQAEPNDDGIDTPEDIAYVDAAWQRHLKTISSKKASPNPFESWTVSHQNQVAQLLQVPRPLVNAFRDQMFDITTVPEFFLRRLAAAMKQPFDHLKAYFSSPLAYRPAMQYKATSKPIQNTPVSFEQFLVDLGLSETERARILSEDC